MMVIRIRTCGMYRREGGWGGNGSPRGFGLVLIARLEESRAIRGSLNTSALLRMWVPKGFGFGDHPRYPETRYLASLSESTPRTGLTYRIYKSYHHSIPQLM